MAELGEGLPQAKPGIVDRVIGALKVAAKTFEIDTRPVPIDQINAGKVATTIQDHIWNKFRKDPYANGFDMATLLGQLNYPAMWAGEDSETLRSRNPEAYDKSQAALAELEKRGVIEYARDPETGAVIRYYVKDAKKLEEIASTAKSSKK